MNGYLRIAIVLLLTFILTSKAGGQNQTVTNGTATTPVNFTGAGCRYNWTNDNPNIGLPASGIGNIASFTAVNNGTTPITANITATPAPAGYAYIPNGANDSVSVINLATNTAKAKILVGQTPYGEAITPDGSKVYVANIKSHSVSVITTATNTVTTIPLVNFTTGAGYVLTDQDYVPVAGQPTFVAISPDGKSVYVANHGIAYTIIDSFGRATNVYILYVIDTATGNVGMISLGVNPGGLCFNPDGTLLYVSDYTSNIISVINVKQTNAVSPLVISGGGVSAGVADVVGTIVENSLNGATGPYIMVVTPDVSRIYVANNGNGTVSAINTATNTVAATINVGQQPTGICISPDGSKVYVATVISNSVAVISTATNSVIQTYNSLFNSPTDIALSSDGKLLYVANGLSNSLAVLDVTSTANRVLANIPAANAGVLGNFIAPGNCSGSPVTFTITVNPTPLPGDATLSALSISTGTLGPAFAPTATNYIDNVSYATTSVSLQPMANNPSATITVDGVAVASGSQSPNIPLSPGKNTVTIVVTAEDGTTTKTYTILVVRGSINANLTNLKISIGALTPAFATATTSYTRSVGNTITNITITPITADPTATVTVNGTPVASGSASGNIALNVGPNVINTVVTAQDGITKMTYTITVTRAASTDATLSHLTISPGTIKPAFTSANSAYSVAVGNGVTSVTVTPTTNEPNATIKIGGKAVVSGTASAPIVLAVGANTIANVITAQNGVTSKNYKIIVTRAPSNNAKLASLTTSSGALTPAFSNTVTSYTRTVSNATTSITFKAIAVDKTATIRVNGVTVASGTSSAGQPLVVGSNTETIKVTAQDGITSITYTVTVKRATGPLNNVYEPVSVTNPDEKPNLDDDIILVHQGLSPNGDGINDFLQIDGILAYPENKLSIMNRSGQLVFESKGYDNSTKVFDGHSNKTGAMQLPGTYFYSLDYTVKGEIKHKTGFIVLKY